MQVLYVILLLKSLTVAVTLHAQMYQQQALGFFQVLNLRCIAQLQDLQIEIHRYQAVTQAHNRKG